MHKYIEIFLFAVRRHISFVELMAVIYWFEVERFIRLWCLCNFLSAAVNTCRQQWARWVVVVCANYRLICHITRSIDPSASCTQDATRSEFDPVESGCPYISGRWESGSWV